MQWLDRIANAFFKQQMTSFVYVLKVYTNLLGIGWGGSGGWQVCTVDVFGLVHRAHLYCRCARWTKSNTPNILRAFSIMSTVYTDSKGVHGGRNWTRPPCTLVTHHFLLNRPGGDSCTPPKRKQMTSFVIVWRLCWRFVQVIAWWNKIFWA